MSSVPGTVLIVGSSVAGVRTAQALRSERFEGRIVLVGAEPEVPYDKPPLSKQFLAGAWDAERVALLTAEDAVAAGIELRLGSAAQRLDIASRRLLLTDGQMIGYDAAVLATGASARPSPWQAASGVHVLRTLADARSLRAELSTDQPVLVVGGGFIGAEVAATIRGLGRDVTVVDPLPVPVGRVVGTELGEHFTHLHHRHGVATRFGAGVESISGRAGDLQVTLTDGELLTAGIVVVGIGAFPNDDWLATSGLSIENGIVCDEHGRAAGREWVYAAGDVARWYHAGHGEHVRVEHWTSAVEQAACVAHNIAHPEELRVHTAPEYIWSDQYDWRIQIVGRPARADRHELIGTLSGEKPRAAAVYPGSSGLLQAAVTVNWPKALVICRRLLAADASFEDALAQLSVLAPALSPNL